MKLNEFFGHTLKPNKPAYKDKNKISNDELFWFILDHDELYKKHAIPIARTIKKAHALKNIDKEACLKEFMKMVEDGCKKYYAENKMHGKLGKFFPKDLREEMCNRLYEHYYNNVTQGKYDLGDVEK